MLLEDRIAIITAGAGAGIGRAVATRFMEEGAEVMLTDAHPRRTPETAEELSKKFGREVPWALVDVTQRAQIESRSRKLSSASAESISSSTMPVSTNSSTYGSARTRPGTWCSTYVCAARSG
jgi:NADP-dependent 3-hydroxy acid dehydrogenase YdfG